MRTQTMRSQFITAEEVQQVLDVSRSKSYQIIRELNKELSFMNMAANKDTYGQSIEIPPQGDDFDTIREEYTEMLRGQLARGNNGLIKTKYLTFLRLPHSVISCYQIFLPLCLPLSASKGRINISEIV